MSEISNKNAAIVDKWFDTFFNSSDSNLDAQKNGDSALAEVFGKQLDDIREVAKGVNPESGWGLKQGDAATYLGLFSSQKHAAEDVRTLGATYGADGVLDKTEVGEILNNANNAVYALGNADANGDGEVSSEEWQSFTTTDEKGADEAGYGMQSTLKAIDGNGDGKINNEEFNGALSDQLKTLLVTSIADANNDGQITIDEQQAVIGSDLSKPTAATVTPKGDTPAAA